MSKCGLCFPVTGHQADYALTFGKDERILKVCRYCREDLTLLGFNANQTIRSASSKPLKSKNVRFWFLGPVQTCWRLLNE